MIPLLCWCAIGYSDDGPLFWADLLAVLDAPIAYDRLRFLWAVEDVLGRELRKDEYDLTAAPGVRKAQASALRRKRLELGELPQ